MRGGRVTRGAPGMAWLRWLVRLAVAVGLVTFAIRLALPEDGPGLVAALSGAWVSGPGEALAWLAAATAILGVSFAFGARRFQILLRAGGLDAAWPVLFRGYIAAGFFNLVLPGAILGDAYRAWDARRDLGRGAQVAGLVVLERLLSLAALGSIGLAVAPVLPLGRDDSQLAIALVAVSALFVASALLALLPTANRLLRRALDPLSRVAPRAGRAALGALAAVATIAARPRVVARAFGWSLLCQGLPVVAVFALSTPLDAGVAWYWYAVIVPFVTLVALLPISLGGAGVRESLYVAFFGTVGMKAEVALALSLSVFAVSMVWAGVGFGVVVLGRRRTARRAATSAPEASR